MNGCLTKLLYLQYFNILCHLGTDAAGVRYFREINLATLAYSQIPTRSKLHKYSYIYSHRYWLTFYDVVKSLQMTSGSLIVRWLKTRNCLRCANLDL